MTSFIPSPTASSMIEDEILTLNCEFEWLLLEIKNTILKQIYSIIIECSRRFPVHIPGIETVIKTEKYQLQSTSNSMNDQIKVSCTLNGDKIANADINIRLHKHPQVIHRTSVQSDNPWKLNQILDASNHLRSALNLLEVPLRSDDNSKLQFKTAEEVVELIKNIMVCLQLSKNCLIIPKKRSIEELQSSCNTKILQPALPNDLAISFYIQAQNLICSVYHMYKDNNGMKKYDVSQAEISIPWLNEALLLLTIGIQYCQQVKDKVLIFTQYKDMQII